MSCAALKHFCYHTALCWSVASTAAAFLVFLGGGFCFCSFFNLINVLGGSGRVLFGTERLSWLLIISLWYQWVLWSLHGLSDVLKGAED